MTLPSTVVPLIASMQALASSPVSILTKPKPRDSSRASVKWNLCSFGTFKETEQTDGCEGRT